MGFADEIAKYFPEGYWSQWEKMFGHDFFSCHIQRTSEYDMDFVGRDFAGKSVLEVGGFPGLLMSLYLKRKAKEVLAIDHPDYRPSWYLEWVDGKFMKSIAHDTNKGAPPLSDLAHFDIMCMSDVLLHNSGFPSVFMEWCIAHCDKIYLLNQKGEGHIEPASIMNLHAGFTMPTNENIIAEMERLGAKFSYQGVSGDRNLLIFEGKKYEVPDSDSALRNESISSEIVPESGHRASEG